jgi:glycyl-tRNA synthetase beta chain
VSNNLLFELQTEELPPKSLSQLISQLVANVRLELNKVQIDFTDIRGFATPRRLALIVTDMAARQPDQVLERRGPALQAALDQDGEPTKALGGFLRSCGLTDISQLQQQETPKGTWLVYEQHKAGAGVGELIEAVISQSLANLPIDRKMRWGATRTEFVRPVHSAILLYGDEVLPARFFDCDTGRVTLGHRFMGQGETCIASANDYIEALRAEYVIVDFE